MQSLLLVALLPALPLGIPSSQTPPTACAAEEIYEQFLIVQKSREQVVRKYRTNFTERSTRMTDDKPLGSAAGYVDFSDDRERWVRWEISAGASAGFHAIDHPEKFAELARNSVRPSIDITDGIQTVQMAPVRSQSKHWDGLFEEGISTVIRRGALNCGILFFERWITDYIELYTPTDCTVAASGLTILTLVPRRDPEGPHSLQVYLDDDLFCHSLVMKRGDLPHVEAHVDTRILLEGELVPATGRNLFHYDVPVILQSTLSYSAGVPLPSDSYLETLPSEIHEIGGTASVTDAAGRHLGHLSPPSSVVESHSRPQPPADTPPKPAPLDDPSNDSNWTRTAAVAVASIAALALFISLRRR